MSLSVNGDNSQHVNGTTSSSNVKTPKTSTKKNPIPLKGKKKKAAKKRYDYKLGPREGNTRIIGPDSISTRRQTDLSILLNKFNNANPIQGKIDLTKIKLPKINNNNHLNPDGSVGTFKQGQRGDCYFLAEINAIKNTKDGQKLLDQNVKYNAEEGTYTVTLPGAVKMRQAYKKDGLGDKCEITGTYTITKDALEKAKKLAGDSYSAGDIEVIALEIAMENYRAELAITNKNTGNVQNSRFTAEGAGASNTQDLLAGGHTYDAGFILTGQKSEVYFNSNKMQKPDKLYTAGEYGFITEEEMNAQNRFISSRLTYNTAKGMSEVTSVTSNNAALTHKLDKYQGKEDKYALTCYVTCAKKGDDGVTQAGGGHAVTILKITDDVVYVQNPWYDPKDSNKKGKTIEPIPRADFEKMASGFVAQDMNASKIGKTRLHNTVNDIFADGNKPHRKISSHDLQLANQILAKISHNNGSHRFNGINSDNLNTLITKIQKKTKKKLPIETLNKLTTTNLKGKDKVTTDKMITYLQAQNNTQLSPELLKDIQELIDKLKPHNS